MLARAVLVLVLACACLARAASPLDSGDHGKIPTRTSFTATVYVKDRTIFHGGMYGAIRYDYAHSVYEIKLTSRRHVELFKYNAQRGLGLGPRPFEHQYSYVCSDGCDCTVGALDHSMPILFHYSKYYIDLGPIHLPGFDSFTGYSNCHKFVPSMQYTAAFVSAIAVDPNDGFLCWVAFKDGRQLFFVNQVESYFLEGDFEAPLNVRCSKSIDLCIAVDRSTSVTRQDWALEKDFLRRFVQQLFIGSSQVHLSIVSYNTDAWTELTLAQGTTYQNAINTVENMDCNASTSEHSQLCHRGWTSLSEGISKCTGNLWGSPRAFPETAKVVLVLTDGYHNMLRRAPNRKEPYNPRNETRDLCYQDCWSFVEGTPEWFECAATDLKRCRDDLAHAITQAEHMLKGLKMIALGVGGTVSADELLMIAQNNSANVVRRKSFAELQTTSLELVARTCSMNTVECGQHCCGFCACSRCQRPDFCDDRHFCTRDILDGTCCFAVPRGCITEPSKCLVSECRDEACHSETKACPPANGCFGYECDSSTGVCVPYPAQTPVQPGDVIYCNYTTIKSETRSKCFGSVADYSYSWSVSVQRCEALEINNANSVNCTESMDCPPSRDPCYKAQCTDLQECRLIEKDCDDGKGCTDDACVNGECTHTLKNCDDLNPCTTEWCVAESGECAYEEVSCNDFNECTIDSCSFSEGCVHTPVADSACEDNDLCTTDRCDPAFGCVHDPVHCTSDDACFLAKCERFRGCIVEPFVCRSLDNCSLGYCETTPTDGPACRIERLQCKSWDTIKPPSPSQRHKTDAPSVLSPSSHWFALGIALPCVLLAALLAAAAYFVIKWRRTRHYQQLALSADALASTTVFTDHDPSEEATHADESDEWGGQL